MQGGAPLFREIYPLARWSRLSWYGSTWPRRAHGATRPHLCFRLGTGTLSGTVGAQLKSTPGQQRPEQPRRSSLSSLPPTLVRVVSVLALRVQVLLSTHSSYRHPLAASRTFFPAKGRGLADFESAKRGISKSPLHCAANPHHTCRKNPANSRD